MALPAAGEAGSQLTWSLHSPGESGSHTTVPRSCAQRGTDETQPRGAMPCCLIFYTMKTLLVAKCVPWWTVPPPRQSCPPLDAFQPGRIPLHFLSIPFWVVTAEQLPLPALPPQTVSVQGGSVPMGSHWLRDVGGQGPCWGKVAGAALGTWRGHLPQARPSFLTKAPRIPYPSRFTAEDRGSEGSQPESRGVSPGASEKAATVLSPAGWGSSEASAAAGGRTVCAMRAHLGLRVPGGRHSCVRAGGYRSDWTDFLKSWVTRTAIWR